MKLGILKGYSPKDHLSYVASCEELQIEYEVVDFLDKDWIDLVLQSNCDGFLCHPPCDFAEWKAIYDERLYFLNKVLNKPIYPSYEELYIYENKRNLSYWLKIFDLPHPETYVFTRKDDALEYFKNATFPLVFKSNTGAASTGVSIIKSKAAARRMASVVFGYGHPALALGKLRFVTNKNNVPIPFIGDLQNHYLIVQKFYQIKWEWRIIRIGNSYFGHKKLLKGQFASGSGEVGWDTPSKELLHLVKKVSSLRGFRSMAVDIFETTDGDFLINEIQSMFGSYLPYQMKVDEVPGRYKYVDDLEDFIFEEGVFNTHNSKLLRVKHFVEILKS